MAGANINFKKNANVESSLNAVDGYSITINSLAEYMNPKSDYKIQLGFQGGNISNKVNGKWDSISLNVGESEILTTINGRDDTSMAIEKFFKKVYILKDPKEPLKDEFDDPIRNLEIGSVKASVVAKQACSSAGLTCDWTIPDYDLLTENNPSATYSGKIMDILTSLISPWNIMFQDVFIRIDGIKITIFRRDISPTGMVSKGINDIYLETLNIKRSKPIYVNKVLVVADTPLNDCKNPVVVAHTQNIYRDGSSHPVKTIITTTTKHCDVVINEVIDTYSYSVGTYSFWGGKVKQETISYTYDNSEGLEDPYAQRYQKLISKSANIDYYKIVTSINNYRWTGIIKQVESKTAYGYDDKDKLIAEVVDEAEYSISGSDRTLSKEIQKATHYGMLSKDLMKVTIHDVTNGESITRETTQSGELPGGAKVSFIPNTKKKKLLDRKVWTYGDELRIEDERFANNDLISIGNRVAWYSEREKIDIEFDCYNLSGLMVGTYMQITDSITDTWVASDGTNGITTMTLSSIPIFLITDLSYSGDADNLICSVKGEVYVI